MKASHIIMLCAALALPALAETDQNGTTPDNDTFLRALDKAHMNHDLEPVKMLIQAGADVNGKRTADSTSAYPPFLSQTSHGTHYDVVGKAGTTIASNQRPLTGAIMSGDAELVRLLLDAGADVEGDAGEGVTPLMVAAWFMTWPGRNNGGHTEIMRELLERGADVNARSATGMTAMHYAGLGGAQEAVDMLLQAGADPEARDNAGRSYRHFAALSLEIRMPWSQTRRLILRALPDAEINDKDAEGRNVLSYVMMSFNQMPVDDDLPALSALLAKGADVNARDSIGWTPLNYALRCREYTYQKNVAKRVGLLLEAGADPNQQDIEGMTPLMYSVILSTGDSPQLMLQHGADVNIADNNGDTALLYAISASSPVEVVQALIDAGADVNVRDKDGWTPLMLAMAGREKHPEIVPILLAAGADTSVTAPDGRTFEQCQQDDSSLKYPTRLDTMAWRDAKEGGNWYVPGKDGDK